MIEISCLNFLSTDIRYDPKPRFIRPFLIALKVSHHSYILWPEKDDINPLVNVTLREAEERVGV